MQRHLLSWPSGAKLLNHTRLSSQARRTPPVASCDHRSPARRCPPPAAELRALLAERFAAAPAGAWITRLTAAGLSAQVARDVQENMADPVHVALTSASCATIPNLAGSAMSGVRVGSRAPRSTPCSRGRRSGATAARSSKRAAGAPVFWPARRRRDCRSEIACRDAAGPAVAGGGNAGALNRARVAAYGQSIAADRRRSRMTCRPRWRRPTSAVPNRSQRDQLRHPPR